MSVELNDKDRFLIAIGEALKLGKIVKNNEPSREISLAMTKLEEANFWAMRGKTSG